MNGKILYNGKNITFLVSLFIIIISIIGFSGCKKKETVEQAQQEEEALIKQENQIPTFGICIADKNDVFTSSICKSMEELSNGKATLIFNYADNQANLQEQQLTELISQNVNVLMVHMVNGGNTKSLIDKAKAADIPIIFFNREPDGDIIKSYDKAKYVGATPLEAGIIQGELIVDLWRSKNYDRNNDGIIQYVLLEGEKGNPDAIARTKWFAKAIEENGIKTKLLASSICDWDKKKGKQAMKTMINQYGNQIDFIVSNNDNMAIGAINALQEKGYNKGGNSKIIPIVGVDGLEEVRKYIANGQMSGTVVQDAVGTAKVTLAMGINAALGNDFLYKTEYVYDETQYAVRINYFKYDPTQE